MYAGDSQPENKSKRTIIINLSSSYASICRTGIPKVYVFEVGPPACNQMRQTSQVKQQFPKATGQV